MRDDNHEFYGHEDDGDHPEAEIFGEPIMLIVGFGVTLLGLIPLRIMQVWAENNLFNLPPGVSATVSGDPLSWAVLLMLVLVITTSIGLVLMAEPLRAFWRDSRRVEPAFRQLRLPFVVIPASDGLRA